MTGISDDRRSDLHHRIWKRLEPILISEVRAETALDMHEAIERGFARRRLIGQDWLSAFFERLMALEDGSRSTEGASSNRSRKRLSSQCDGYIYQLAVVFEEALDALGSDELVIEFLKQPSIGLEQRKPIDLMTTPPGVQLVRTHIERMRYGVYS